MEALLFRGDAVTVDQAESLDDADHLRHNELTTARVTISEDRLGVTFDVATDLPEVGDPGGPQVAQVVMYVGGFETYSLTAQRDAEGVYEVQGVEIDVVGDEARGRCRLRSRGTASTGERWICT